MKTVAIPIETKVREFYGKLWLGLNLLERGHQVVLGQVDEIKNTIHLSEPDVYITKDPGDNNIDFFQKLQNAGCKVCGLDTEGAVFPTLEDFTRNKNESLRYFDRYFMWGEAQAEILRKRTDNPEAIIPTGNPRFDLLNPPLRSIYYDEATQHRSEFNPYVLFNMNFSWANHYQPKKHIEQQNRLFGSYDIEKYSYISELYNEFITAIHSLRPHTSKFNIVVRPHPSEDHKTYKRIFRNYDNVFIRHSGDVRGWIAGAAVVVHNSCTTGIESAMMEQPTIAYRPIENPEYDKELPNIVSEKIDTRTDLSERISYYVDNDEPYEMTDDQRRELKRYFHNVDTVAAKSIAEHIDTLEIPAEQSYSHLKPELIERIKWRAKASDFSDVAIRAYDSINAAFGNTEPTERRKYRRQKFPGLTEEEIRTTLQRFETDIGTENIEITPVSRVPDTFVLEPK